MHGNVVDRTGQVFGRLTVTCQAESKKSDTKKGHHARWLCQCECGRFIKVDAGALRIGATKSCGCLKKESNACFGARQGLLNIKHGHACSGNRSRTYRSWEAMKYRCLNTNSVHWKYYGGSGIRICDRWLNSFEAFLSDMGNRQTGMSLDRYPDPYGDYEPKNCRWATPKEQQSNRRDQVERIQHGTVAINEPPAHPGYPDWAKSTE